MEAKQKYDVTLEPRERLRILMNMSQDELLAIVNDTSLPYFDQKCALAIRHGDWKVLASMTDQADKKVHAGGRPSNALKEKQKKWQSKTQPGNLERFLYQDTAQSNNPITVEKLLSLKFAMCIGATIKEACEYANLSEFGYRYWLKNMPAKLREEWDFAVSKWRHDTILKARNTVYENLEEIGTAKWYLERKRRDEFATRTEQELKKVEKFEGLSDETLDEMIGTVNDNEQPSNE